MSDHRRSAELLRRRNNLISWARLDPELPGGIHEPKLPGDVGWDLEAMVDVTVWPMQAVDIPVNARMELPEGIWAEIRARSSIVRRGLSVEAGIIDTGYRGPLFVLVRNMQLHGTVTTSGPLPEQSHDTNTVEIKAGERIGQIIFNRICPVWAGEVDEIDMETSRGEAGFGSTNGE